MNNLHWLQYFYLDLCDGDWEDFGGLDITTLDNPGWDFRFDLSETPFENMSPNKIQIRRSEYDWVYCEFKDKKFVGGGGALNLDEIIGILKKWIVDSKIDIEPLPPYEEDPFIPEGLREFVKNQKKSWRDDNSTKK